MSSITFNVPKKRIDSLPIISSNDIIFYDALRRAVSVAVEFDLKENRMFTQLDLINVNTPG